MSVLFIAERTGTITNLEGRRAFSREFVKEEPLTCGGFEIEAGLTTKAVIEGWRVVEIQISLA